MMTRKVNDDQKKISSSEEDQAMNQPPVLLSVPENIDQKTLLFISEDAARRYKTVPFLKEGNALSVAMVNPYDGAALNMLRFFAEKENVSIKIFLVSESIFFDIVKLYAGTEIALQEAIVSMKDQSNQHIEKKQEKSIENLQSFQNAPIATLVSVIIKHALERRSSDIHIEPVEGNFRVRFRVDGILSTQLVLPIEIGRAVTARIKILSNLKIDEKRKPQDGRFRFEEEGTAGFVDLRVSSFPVLDGEKVVMRVLDKSSNSTNVEDLGLLGRNKDVLETHVKEPNGIILITGPTGSGKTTTLYAFLQSLNGEDKNIVTLEDPVEYYVEGINQSQIKPEIGYTFASGLRSILRQDPNVIMVGEIRDMETAELAIHAALTGHLVFSTLHTNDAIGAIPRLIDMGIEPFLLASTLQVVAAQRLVRRICSHCAEQITLTELQKERMQALFDSISVDEKKVYGLNENQKIIFFQGKGCKECGMSGFKGRLALYEVVEIDDNVRAIISDKQGNEIELQKYVIEKQRMMTMKQEGLLMALKKITTLSEIERVTEGKILIDEE